MLVLKKLKTGVQRRLAKGCREKQPKLKWMILTLLKKCSTATVSRVQELHKCDFWWTLSFSITLCWRHLQGSSPIGGPWWGHQPWRTATSDSHQSETTTTQKQLSNQFRQRSRTTTAEGQHFLLLALTFFKLLSSTRS